jgi:hypothetical protein
MVSNPITCCSVTHSVLTTRGMKRPARIKSISSVRLLERGSDGSTGGHGNYPQAPGMRPGGVPPVGGPAGPGIGSHRDCIGKLNDPAGVMLGLDRLILNLIVLVADDRGVSHGGSSRGLARYQTYRKEPFLLQFQQSFMLHRSRFLGMPTENCRNSCINLSIYNIRIFAIRDVGYQKVGYTHGPATWL